MAGKKIKIDFNEVNELIEQGGSGAEIAAYLGMHADTLYDRVKETFKINYCDYAAKYRSKGDMKLRVAQYNKAVKKLDNSMLIWLGKQRLGQKENPSEKIVPEDIMSAFTALMNQLTLSQKEAAKAEKLKEQESALSSMSIINSSTFPAMTECPRESAFN